MIMEIEAVHHIGRRDDRCLDNGDFVDIIGQYPTMKPNNLNLFDIGMIDEVMLCLLLFHHLKRSMMFQCSQVGMHVVGLSVA